MPNSINFAPASFFFTEPTGITQDAGQAFGPVSADQFRLTSKFTVTGSGTKAYAVCTGVVLIQPQTGSSSKINLILRPYKQPIAGLNIQYFIYRGLNISDFFAAGKVIAATSSTSDLINSINASFAAFYASTQAGSPLPEFLAKYIGFNPSMQADTLPMSDLFFKQSVYTTGSSPSETEHTAFDLPMIAAGSSLGTFITGECGFDVVLGYGDYSLPVPNDQFVFNLAYARAAEAILDLTGQTDNFKKKLIKEQIFQFIDAAAYYGFHYRENGKVVVNNAGTKTNKSGEQIYTDVIQNLYTKNRLYLYIQSDRTRSYNFYANYFIDGTGTNSNSLKKGAVENALSAADYNTSGWPLLIDEAAQNHSEPRNSLYLQLVTDNNVNTMLYGQVAQIDNAQGNNFCDADNLKLPDAADGTPSIFTKTIALSNPAIGPNGAKLNIANFNILIYQGQTYDYVAGQVTDENNVTTDVLAEPNFFDDVFGELNASALLKAGDSAFTNIASQRVKLINHYYNNTQYGISAVQTSVIHDQIDTDDATTPTLDRVTYITESVDTLNNVVSVSGTLTADTKSSPSISGAVGSSKTYSLPEPFYYGLITFTDDNQTITGLKLGATDGSTPNKIMLGVTKLENELLLALISANNYVNPRLFLFDSMDGTDLVSAENILYQKYRVGLVGENSSGTLTLALPVTEIIVYSTDRLFHYSKKYSDYVIRDSVSDYVLDLYVKLDLAE